MPSYSMNNLLLQEEIEKGNTERVKYLLDENGLAFDADWRDYYLLKSALYYKQKDIVKLLLHKGARINKFSHNELKRETTPLHLAISLGCSEIIDIMLNKGASLNVRNNNSETPLALAALIGNYSAVDRILPVTPTEINLSCQDGLTHLHIAAMRNRVDIVKKFLQNGTHTSASIHSKSCNWPGYTALHFAAEFQCLETVEVLINFGADVTVKNTYGFTPLHLAFKNQNESIIDLILSVHCYIYRNPVNSDGLSHFHIACTKNNAKVIENFLKWGIDVDSRVNKDAFKWSSYTPLSFAIQYQRIDVIKQLLMYNPDISRDLLQLAYETSNVKIIDLIYTKLSQRSIKNSSSLSHLHVACVANDVHKVQELLNSQSVNDLINLPTWFGYTPLHLAVQERNTDIVKLLIESDANVTAKDAREKTALHLAFEKGEKGIVDLLLAGHIFELENPIDTVGLSHVHIACTRSDLNLIEDFLRSEVIDVNSRLSSESPFWPGYTPLHFACTFLQKEVVQLLLDHGADVMALNDSRFTPLESLFGNNYDILGKDKVDFLQICGLLLSARENENNGGFFITNGLSRFHIACAIDVSTAAEHLSTVQLINKPVYLPNWSGRTPLHFAAYFNRQDVIEYLLDVGADPTIKDSKGFSALALGVLRNSYNGIINLFDPCEKLLYYNGNMNNDTSLLHFHLACSMAHEKVIEFFLQRGVDVNSFFDLEPNQVRTPLLVLLYTEVDSDKKASVEILLKNGADVNKADLYMNTPLHFAVQYTDDDVGIIELLFNYGADVNSIDLDGDTPLHIGIQHLCSPKIINALLESGTDVNIENNEGYTFLMKFPIGQISDPEFLVEEEVFPIALSLMKHVNKLQIVNFHVSDKNKRHYHNLLSKYNQGERQYFVEADFVKECESELNFMKTVRLDNYTTLRDIVFKEPGKMALHAENIEFRQILESEDFTDKFPIFGFILKLQLKKGLIRKSVLESSKVPIRSLSTIKLPDSCYEHITQYLSNVELNSLIKSSSQ